MHDEQPVETAELDNFDLRSPAEIVAAEANEPEAPAAPTDEPAEPAKEDAPLTDDPQPEEPKEEPKPYQAPQKVQVEIPKFEREIPVDEYGNIDPEKFGEYLQARDEHIKLVAEATAQNAYFENNYMQREWSDVTEAYPEIAKSDDLRMMVENLRTADAIRGGEGSLMTAAEQIDKLMASKVAEGRESATTTITRQKSVALPSSPRSQNIDANKTANLRKAAARGDESARIALLSDLYESGKLNA